MDKNQREVRLRQEDADLNRGLLWVVGAVLLECLLMVVNRWYINFYPAEIGVAEAILNVMRVLRLGGGVVGLSLIHILSGTGKTTLSADPNRKLIGDDEHGWADDSVFNFEGGCYAKCIDLTEEREPEIYRAIKFGSLVENVIIDEETRQADYADGSLTENTRVGYPVDYIPNAAIPGIGGTPKTVIFLTADAYGVMPPISKLNAKQAQYYFVSGFTSKLAGTERGITSQMCIRDRCCCMWAAWATP